MPTVSLSLLLLCAAAATQAPARPSNPLNITIFGLRPKNQTGLVNKDTADAAGDLFFYLADKLLLPYACHKDPSWPLCFEKHESEDNVYTQYVLEVDSRFGGCPDGGPECTKYARCNPSDSSGSVFRCVPSTPAVGKANVSERYDKPHGKELWDIWKFNASKLLGGWWYSTQDKGECGVGDKCEWRIVETVKTVDAKCVNHNVHQAVRNKNPGCFDSCANPSNITSDCFITCFYGTVFGYEQHTGMVPMQREELVEPWIKSFKSTDLNNGGCQSLPLNQ